MKKTQTVTCRYGISYDITFEGSKGAILRSCDLMSKCCCWVCHNHDCKNPRNEKLDNCKDVCEIWFKKHPCEK